jgi:hypothetical protein
MKCIIQVDESGNYVNHPITLDNFIQAFPDVDISGDVAPTGYAWFTRKEQNSVVDFKTVTVRQRIETSYTKTSDGLGFEDTFTVIDLTEEEVNTLIDNLKNNPPAFIKSWTLETDTYFWIPPTERPKGRYRWNEPTGVWVECTTGTNTETDIPTPAKIPTAWTPESALPKPPIANTSNTVTANT